MPGISFSKNTAGSIASSDSPAQARDVEAVLARIPETEDKPRRILEVWNKIDLVPEDERATRVAAFVKAYRWKGPVHVVAAVNGEGCRELVFAVQAWLDAHPAPAAAPAEDDVPLPAPAAPAPASGAAPVVLRPAPLVPRRRRRAPEGES